jgi:hypothetical protein
VSWLLSDRFLYLLYASRGPWGYRESRGFLSFDPEARAYRLDWFDDRGRVVKLVGTLGKPGELDLLSDPKANGTPVRAEVRRREDGKLLLTLELVPAGSRPEPLLEALLTLLPPSE